MKITNKIIDSHGLKQEEYKKITTLIGKEPNLLELGIFSAMWNEHCSYKSSKKYLKTLPTKNKKVIITASPDKKERDRVEKIISLCKSKPVNFTGQLTLKQLAYLSYKAELYFGVDTAPMHMATAVDTTVLALMGGSEVIHWGPWSNTQMKNNYKNIDGRQSMGKNIVISDMNHDILYIDNIKKCQGMLNIQLDNVLKIIDEKL